jgi:hypothetical protein
MLDGRVVITETSLKKLCGKISVLVFQESFQYQALVDMRVKIACPLTAGHYFSDALMRWGCFLTKGRTDNFCRKFCFMELACVFQLFSFLESASFVRPDKHTDPHRLRRTHGGT